MTTRIFWIIFDQFQTLGQKRLLQFRDLNLVIVPFAFCVNGESVVPAAYQQPDLGEGLVESHVASLQQKSVSWRTLNGAPEEEADDASESQARVYRPKHRREISVSLTAALSNPTQV